MKISSRPEEPAKANVEPAVVAVRGVLNQGSKLGSIDITTTARRGKPGKMISANGDIEIIKDIIFVVQNISEELGAEFADLTVKF